MKNQNKKKISLRLVSIVCVCAGVFTAIPWPSAGHTSIMGYYALCPFSPISTIILFYAALNIHGHLRRIENRS